LPALGTKDLALLGLSSGTYAALKTVENKAPQVRTPVEGQSTLVVKATAGNAKGETLMKIRISYLLLIAVLIFCGCASIPPEAPELSAQLGSRIAAMEGAHFRLLDSYFNEKRAKVDEFVQETWIPIFAKEFFEDQEMASMWNEVVASGDSRDRLRFLTMMGPKLLTLFDNKRKELIRPLDLLEQSIQAKIKAEYEGMYAVNNTLTSFLYSASKVEENRKRYLGVAGVTDSAFDKAVKDTDKAVEFLLSAGPKADQVTDQVAGYKRQLDSVLSTINK